MCSSMSALGCEGIVSKRLGSSYRSGRTAHWIKVKNPKAPAVKREAEGRMAMTSNRIAARVIPWEAPDVWGIAIELRGGRNIAYEVGSRAITELECRRIDAANVRCGGR